jgi:hypothetical protein
VSKVGVNSRIVGSNVAKQWIDIAPQVVVVSYTVQQKFKRTNEQNNNNKGQ